MGIARIMQGSCNRGSTVFVIRAGIQLFFTSSQLDARYYKMKQICYTLSRLNRLLLLST